MNETNHPPRLRFGTAHLTREGILFAGSYYSSRFAIRQGWFERALPAGGEPIPVSYRAGCYPPTELYLDAGAAAAVAAESEGGEPHTARILDKAELAPAILQAYQERFRSLLEERVGLLGGRTV